MEKVNVQISTSTYFATSMPSRGCCACDRYDNNSIVRRVGVLLRRKDGCEAEIKGCGGCSVVENVNVLIFFHTILCYKYAIMWLLCM